MLIIEIANAAPFYEKITESKFEYVEKKGLKHFETHYNDFNIIHQRGVATNISSTRKMCFTYYLLFKPHTWYSMIFDCVRYPLAANVAFVYFNAMHSQQFS